MKEEIVVEIYDGKKLVDKKEFTNYDRACVHAQNEVRLWGFTAKIKRLVDGKPWAVTTMYPPETF